jgi:hypothetical protein
MVRALTAFRADVIAWRHGFPTVVECKPYAGLAAFGQVLGYAYLFKQQMGYDPGKLIITDRPRPDLPEVCNLAGIELLYLTPVNDALIDLAEHKSRSRIEELPR